MSTHDAGAGASSPPRTVYPLHIHITIVFTALIFLFGLAIGIANYLHIRDYLVDSAKANFMEVSRNTANLLETMQDDISSIVNVLSRSDLYKAVTMEERMQNTPLFFHAMETNPDLSAVYIGYETGDFLVLDRVLSVDDMKRFEAPPGTAFLLRNLEIHNSTPKETAIYYNADQEVIEKKAGKGLLQYDPRVRPWYIKAMATHETVRPLPYAIYASKEIGLTVSRQSPDGTAVVGADVSLASLAVRLDASRRIKKSEMILFNNDRYVLYYSKDKELSYLNNQRKHDAATIDEIHDAFLTDIKGALFTRTPDMLTTAYSQGVKWIIFTNNINTFGELGYFLSVAVPEEELLRGAWLQAKLIAYLTLIVLLLSIPVTWFFARRISRDLVKLSGIARNIRRFNFEQNIPVTSTVKEVYDLAEDLNYTRNAIKHFIDINTTLTSEQNLNRMLGLALQETIEAIDGMAGVVYLLSGNGNSLRPQVAWNILSPDKDAPHPGSEEQENLEAFAVSLAENPENHLVEALSARHSLVAMIGEEEVPGERLRQALGHVQQIQMIAVPLKDSHGIATGVLALYRDECQRDPNQDMLSFIENLSIGIAISIEKHQLVQELRNLLDSFIELLAGAIDAKSHYTGGHCQRVPVIVRMLAEELNKASAGVFADFHLNESGWDALRLATWMHDCGKITTPEYVVDKATKLETIFNRIHEIRTRFEVLKRDAEIDCLKAILAGEDRKAAEARFHDALAALDDDFSFIADCNVGGEAMSDERLLRLRQIAERRWRRTLSDRIGISKEERRRKERSPEEPLPVEEPLLADKPEHIIEHDATDATHYGKEWGFTLRRPEHKYNLGEVSNLSIRKGTLNAEERYKINEHIMQTIVMLSQLHFPKHLRRIPEIAGGHHERLDGTGYPRGLTKKDMSVEARMVAIADIFEALTAADRPYKDTMSLNASLRIMAGMIRDGYLDPDIFRIFVEKGVYRQYAEKYLTARQTLEAVDEQAILAICDAAVASARIREGRGG